MDPNANLQEQLELVRRIMSSVAAGLGGPLRGPQRRREFLEDGLRLAELVEALDGWMTAGGALPTRWVAPWVRP